MSLTVYTNNDYKITTKYINEESFSSDTTAFIQIDKISREYRLKFSDEKLPVEINEKWSNEIEGIGKEGAFFKFNENGGIKVRKSEKITVGLDYYLLCKYDPTKFVDGAVCDKVGEIYLTQDNWTKSAFGVYRIRFTVITQRNTSFCLDQGVLLVYDSPKLNPIWPPCNKKEQLYIYENKQTAKFLFKASGQAEKSVIVHPDKRAIIKDLDENRAIAFIPVDDIERPISIGRPNAPFAFAVTVRHSEEMVFSSKVIAEDAKFNTYSAGECAKLPHNNKIRIKTEFKGTIYVYYNDALEDVRYVNDSVWLYDIKYGKIIKVFHGLDLVFELKFKRASKTEHKSDDESLFKELMSYVGDDIPTPVSFKYILTRLKDHPMISEYIRKTIKTGYVNKMAMHRILKYIRELGGG